MNMQNVKDLSITEGDVRTIHDSNGNLLWGRLAYDTKYGGDTFQQTYSGKNLLPNTLQSGTTSGLTYTVNSDGSIKLTGTATARVEPNLYYNSAAPLIFPAGTYKNTSTYPIILYANGYNVFPAGGSLTFTEEKSVTIAYFRVENTGTALNEMFYPQIIKSSVSDESYEPYVGGTASPNPDYPQDVQVVTGAQTIKVHTANLYDEQQLSLVSGWTRLNDGTIEKTVSYTGNVPSYYDYSVYNPIGTYTISYELRIANPSTTALIMDNRAYIWNKTSTSLKDADGNNVTQAYRTLNSEWKKFSFTITTTESLRWNDGKALHLYMASRTGEPVLQLRHFQIEEGSTASEYQPCQSQTYTVNLGSTELCKIGNYQDYIYKSGDDWYVHKACGKYIADGNTSWTKSAYGTNVYGCYPQPPCVAGQSYSTIVCVKSNCFTGVSYGDRTVAVDNITYTAEGYSIWIRNTSFATKEDLVTFCANNNPVFYYMLATTTNTQITDTTLIAQLNAIHEWLTRYGYNSTVSGNLPLLIEQTNLS